jgi:hypothetical protein
VDSTTFYRVMRREICLAAKLSGQPAIASEFEPPGYPS